MHLGISWNDPSILERPCRLDAIEVAGRGEQAYDLRAGWTPWRLLAGAAGLRPQSRLDTMVVAGRGSRSRAKGGLDIMMVAGRGCRPKT